MPFVGDVEPLSALEEGRSLASRSSRTAIDQCCFRIPTIKAMLTEETPCDIQSTGKAAPCSGKRSTAWRVIMDPFGAREGMATASSGPLSLPTWSSL